MKKLVFLLAAFASASLAQTYSINTDVTFTGRTDSTSSVWVKPMRLVSGSNPATCIPNEWILNTTTKQPLFCDPIAPNVWVPVAGILTVGQLPTGIPAANIGDGSVGNPAFGFIAGLTSDAQAQLNARPVVGACPAGQYAKATILGGLTCGAVKSSELTNDSGFTSNASGNTYTAGDQNMTGAASFEVPSKPGTCAANAAGLCVDTNQGALKVNVNGANQAVPTIDQFLVPTTDLVCAWANDPTINAQAVTNATIAANAVLTVASSAGYINGSHITLSWFGDAGWNATTGTVIGNPTTTLITTSINSSGLTWTAAGSPQISLTCNNSTDATIDTSFATTYTIGSGKFAAQYKQLVLDTMFSVWSSALTTNTTSLLKFKASSTQAYSTSSLAIAPSLVNYAFAGNWTAMALASPGASVPVMFGGFGAFIPGQSIQGIVFGQTTNNLLATNGPIPLNISIRWAATGVSGTSPPSYSAGGTATGTGKCLATASAGGAVALVQVTAGVISGNLLIGTAYPQTKSGWAQTSVPTSWTLSLPSSGAASTCSSTITTTGGSLGAASGNALQLLYWKGRWDN